MPSREDENRNIVAAIILCLMFLGIVSLVIFLVVGSSNSDDGQDDFGNSYGGGVGGVGGGGGGGGSSPPPSVPVLIRLGTPASTTTPPSVVPASGPRGPVLPSGGSGSPQGGPAPPSGVPVPPRGGRVPPSGGPPPSPGRPVSLPGGPVPPPATPAPPPTTTATPRTRPSPPPAPPNRELLCTVGDTAVTVSMYPPDRMCTYLYYTHVVIQGKNIYGAKVQSSWLSYKFRAFKYRSVKRGVSFDHRYITAAKIKIAASALASLSDYNIQHFGVLNVIGKAGNILKAVGSMQPVFDEIKKHLNGSHNVIAIGVRDYSRPSMVSFEQAVKHVVNSFAVDTVIAITSVSSVESRESCRAVPPNILQSSADEKNPSLAKLWYLLKRNATDKQTTTLGLSFEMGTLIYELTSDHNDLASAVNAECNGTALTSREALCGAASVVDKGKQALAAPYLTYGGFPTPGNKRRVVFTDYLHTATARFLNVSGGTGSNNLRSRLAWMLFNVHLGDTAKRCGGILPFELEDSFCKVFLPSGQGC